ncbi:MAG TPA: FRG domain-containing protein [Usitatibacter sp.]|nr:FRG domain-containing protein [Usitatibacter sp.]
MKASARGASRDPFRPALQRIASWDDVARLVEHFSFHRNIPWLFRGVSDSRHALIPLIGRPGWRKPDLHDKGPRRARLPYSKKDEAAVFAMFRNTAIPFLEQQPVSEMEWLAVARHYGVPTRFLDWSERFLVAVWFAANGALEEGDRAGDPGIWVVWGLKSVTRRDLDHPFGVRTPRVYRPPHIVPRFAAQGSVLSIHGDPTKPLNVRNRILIPVERDACFGLLKRLDDAGLNFATVYPGIDGLGKYLRWRYQNAWLAGY